MVLKMTAMLVGLVMFVAASMPQDSTTVASFGVPVDVDAIVQEHYDWIIENEYNLADGDLEAWDPYDHRFIIEEVDTILAGSGMMETYYALLECGKNQFPEYDEHIGETSFYQIKWYVFTEGWLLDKSTHKGHQFSGAVFGGRHLMLDREYTGEGKTITHELVHILYPSLFHKPPFYKIHNKCWRDVWYRGTDE